MDKSKNWCPNCERDTDWLIIPSNPHFLQCKECGYIKEIPHLKVERPKLEKPSIKEKSAIQKVERIVDIGLALGIVLQSALVGCLLGGIWLLLGYLSMSEGNFILSTLFFFLFGITASTIGVYFVLYEAEKIAEKKLKKR